MGQGGLLGGLEGVGGVRELHEGEDAVEFEVALDGHAGEGAVVGEDLPQVALDFAVRALPGARGTAESKLLTNTTRPAGFTSAYLGSGASWGCAGTGASDGIGSTSDMNYYKPIVWAYLACQ